MINKGLTQWFYTDLKAEIKFILQIESRLCVSESHSAVSDSLWPARILEWVAVPFSRGFSQPRDWTQVSHIAGGFFTSWATREAKEYWSE